MTIKNEYVSGICFVVNVMTLLSAPTFMYVVPKSLIVTTYFIISCMIGLLTYIDTIISTNFSKNYQIMKRSGLSEFEIWSSCIFAIFGFQLPNVFMLTYVFHHRAMKTNISSTIDENESENEKWITITLEKHFAIEKLFYCAVTVWITDVCFFYTHKLLHEKFPRIHLLHHCCVYSSMSTNAFFHPLDILVEFSLPIVVIGVISKYILVDDSTWCFVLSTTMMLTWYSLSHDELLHMEHVNHHRYCATGYCIYHNFHYSDPKKEQLRYRISEFRQLKEKGQKLQPAGVTS